MGLFDGQIGGEGFASTAHVATLIAAPVILVLDIGQVSRTAAAIVHGLHTFDPDVRISGVILNKAGCARHAAEVVSALEATGLPVLGVLPRDAGIEVPSRHLGLVPAAERDEAASSLDRLAEQVAEHVDLTAAAHDRVRRPAPGRRALVPGRGGRPALGPAAGGRGRRRPGVHLPLRRDRRAAPGRGLRAGGLRPADRLRAAARYGRALPRRRVPRGARGRAQRERRAAGRAAGGDRRRPAHGRRVRRPALPVPVASTARPMVGAIDGRRDDDRPADPALPHRGRRP